ncbi:hypothetical protein [uncultured Sphingomonas sp.]|uniref:hypothetical protein n=1 Tax=uncultured Sphingomonas sp. TaxID=158754 RepID=UPI0025CC56DE|nr:hypothetical protein [uncultured Sphingomonas sp.]
MPEEDVDPFTFVPVATAPRADGWSAERQRAFIAALASHGGVAAAARAVGMTPQSARRLRQRPDAAGFNRAWDAAVEQGRCVAFDEAMRIAREGRLVPILRRGMLVGHRRRFDNRLLFAACYGVPAARFSYAEAAAIIERGSDPGTR